MAPKDSTETNDTAPGMAALAFDTREFFAFLSETGWSDDQKTEYITLVWGIVCEFAAMGWGIHPIQQARETCGKTPEICALQPDQTLQMIDSSHGRLIEEFVRRNGQTLGENGKGVADV